MKTIITFLNDKGLKPGASYIWQNTVYEGGVFGLALRQFVEHDRMLVCNTPEAYEKTYAAMLAAASEDPRIEPVPIPKGENDEEMWVIFHTIASRIDVGEVVVFDITHGLRSIPFLAFLFAAYLKTAKAVKIEAIYYGAFELGAPSPVIDLSKFIEMIDWLIATTRFVKVGDGEPLANLLRSGIPSDQELRDIPSSRPLRDQLKKAAEAIESISLALAVTRPIEAMQSAAQLEKTLKAAESGISLRAKPFTLLTEQVISEYGQFALDDPTNTAMRRKNLQLQLKMIAWYVERDKIVQAVTLAREWIVSVLVLKFDESISMFDYEGGRKHVEAALNNAVELRKPNPRPVQSSRFDQKLETIPEVDELAKLWGKLTELRNDIAHVGMKSSPQTAANLKRMSQSVYQHLLDLEEALITD